MASPGTTLICLPATGRLRRSSPALSSINANFLKWELASVNLHICISHCHYCQNLLKMLCKLFPSHFTQEVAHVSALHLLVRTSVQNTKSKEDFEIRFGNITWTMAFVVERKFLMRIADVVVRSKLWNPK